MVARGGLTNSYEKKRSKRQRRKEKKFAFQDLLLTPRNFEEAVVDSHPDQGRTELQSRYFQE